MGRGRAGWVHNLSLTHSLTLALRVPRPKSVGPVTPPRKPKGEIVRPCRPTDERDQNSTQTLRSESRDQSRWRCCLRKTQFQSRDLFAHATLRVHVTPSSSGGLLRAPMRAVTRQARRAQPVPVQRARADRLTTQTHQSCSPLYHPPSSPHLSKWPPSPATSSAAVTPPPRPLRCVSTDPFESNIPRARPRLVDMSDFVGARSPGGRRKEISERLWART